MEDFGSRFFNDGAERANGAGQTKKRAETLSGRDFGEFVRRDFFCAERVKQRAARRGNMDGVATIAQSNREFEQAALRPAERGVSFDEKNRHAAEV